METSIDEIANRVISSARNHPSCICDNYPDAWCDLVDQVRNGDYDFMGGDSWRWLRSIIRDQVSLLETEELTHLLFHVKLPGGKSLIQAERESVFNQPVSPADFNRIVDVVESKVVGAAYLEELEHAIENGIKNQENL